MALSVLVVSDVRLVQEGLSAVFTREKGVDTISAVDVANAQALTARLRPDVILFDAAPKGSVEHVRALVASAPEAKVVAFGVKDTGEEILALAAAGTAGYVTCGAESAHVVNVLERLMRDELVCSPRAAASLYRRIAALAQATGEPAAAADGAGSTSVLSRRELQIAQLVDRGLTNKEIARRLGIEATTVKNHVHNMCEKLKVHRRGEAAARVRANLQWRSSPLGTRVPEES
jgi:two-component system, NarL family, nitrate/nitrite response regulator NarL